MELIEAQQPEWRLDQWGQWPGTDLRVQELEQTMELIEDVIIEYEEVQL